MVEDDETDPEVRKATKRKFKCQNEMTARKVKLLLKHSLLFVVVTDLYLLLLFPTPIGLTVDKLR